MSGPMLTRYEQAHSLLKSRRITNDYVRNDTVCPHWISNSDGLKTTRFWYQKKTKCGKEFRLVDISTKSNEPAFDHSILANLLSNIGASDEIIDDKNLPISGLDLPISAVSFLVAKEGGVFDVQFRFMDRQWIFETDGPQLREIPALQAGGFISPDGQTTAFVRDHNIWIRELNNGEERQLTEDGESTASTESTLMV